MQQMLANTSPTVTVHTGRIKTPMYGGSGTKPKVFQNNTLDETAFSEQSFADLSLISGDVSIQVVQGAQRRK